MDLICLEEALEGRSNYQWIDVRSPGEFAHAHIPGALNIPLFSDEERMRVGICYKQHSPLSAMQMGLRFIIDRIVQLQNALVEASESKPILIYCARGGMRSEYVWRLAQALKCPSVRLLGGYKTFREWVLQSFSYTYDLARLGGLTGSGKTAILRRLQDQGGCVVDLEGLAQHRGSVLGGFHRQVAWKTEMFENNLACALDELRRSCPGNCIWLEDESRMIGPCKIPDAFFNQMQQAPLYVLECPRDERLKRVLYEYSSVSNDQLIAAASTLAKRMGMERVSQLKQALESGKRESAALIWLDYYDSLYNRHLRHKNYKLVDESLLETLLLRR